MRNNGLTTIAASGPFAGGGAERDIEDIEMLTCGAAHVAIAWAAFDTLRCPICARLGARYEGIAERVQEITDERDEMEGDRDDAQADERAASAELREARARLAEITTWMESAPVVR